MAGGYRDIVVGIEGTTPDWYRNVYFGEWDTKFSFVKRLIEASKASPEDQCYVAGPNLFGQGTITSIAQALSFLKARLSNGDTAKARILVFGYSRGAYAALRVTQALKIANIDVTYLALFDVVKCTDKDTEDFVKAIMRDFIGIKRKWYQIFGDKIDSEINSGVDISSLPTAIEFMDPNTHFQVPRNAKAGFHVRRDSKVGSRTYPMGHWPLTLEDPRNTNFWTRDTCWGTHSSMGGLPFRGDLPDTITRATEWANCRSIHSFVTHNVKNLDVLNKIYHPTLESEPPPKWWYENKNIRDQLDQYITENGHSDGTGLDPEFEKKCLDLLNFAKSIQAREAFQPKF